MEVTSLRKTYLKKVVSLVYNMAPRIVVKHCLRQITKLQLIRIRTVNFSKFYHLSIKQLSRQWIRCFNIALILYFLYVCVLHSSGY